MCNHHLQLTISDWNNDGLFTMVNFNSLLSLLIISTASDIHIFMIVSVCLFYFIFKTYVV